MYGKTGRKGDDSDVGYRDPKPKMYESNPQPVPFDLSQGGTLDNVASMCPCGHNSVMHGVGLGGSNNAGACEYKGCPCSGFSYKPNQGMGWAYEYSDEKK